MRNNTEVIARSLALLIASCTLIACGNSPAEVPPLPPEVERERYKAAGALAGHCDPRWRRGSYAEVSRAVNKLIRLSRDHPEAMAPHLHSAMSRMSCEPELEQRLRERWHEVWPR